MPGVSKGPKKVDSDAIEETTPSNRVSVGGASGIKKIVNANKAVSQKPAKDNRSDSKESSKSRTEDKKKEESTKKKED